MDPKSTTSDFVMISFAILGSYFTLDRFLLAVLDNFETEKASEK